MFILAIQKRFFFSKIQRLFTSFTNLKRVSSKKRAEYANVSVIVEVFDCWQRGWIVVMGMQTMNYLTAAHENPAQVGLNLMDGSVLFRIANTVLESLLTKKKICSFIS